MFEIRCLVTKKHLPDVITALDGLTVEPPVIKIRNDLLVAPEGQKQTKPKHGGNNNVAELVATYIDGLQKKGIKQVVARNLKELCLANGLSAHSYSYPIAKLVKTKALKTTNTMGVYEVTK